MNFFTALATVEEVLLNIVTDCEQSTAGRIGRCVNTVGARHTLRDRRCNNQISSVRRRLDSLGVENTDLERR